MFVQGYRTFVPRSRTPCFGRPVQRSASRDGSSTSGRQKGVPADELVHIPNGLKHEKYRLVSPIEDRPPLGLDGLPKPPARRGRPRSWQSLPRSRGGFPEVEATVFSPAPPVHETAPWMTVVTDPPQEFIVNEIYNRSRIFLCASRYEGFGFPCVEAMACGAALVTDLQRRIGRLCHPRRDRARLRARRRDGAWPTTSSACCRTTSCASGSPSKAGSMFVETFDWDASAEKLESFLKVRRRPRAGTGHR